MSIGKMVAASAVTAALLVPAAAEAYVLSISRAKIELVHALRDDGFDPRPGMGWYCKANSAHWVSCGMAWRNRGGTRLYCGYGSVKVREGYLIANYRTGRCHP